MKHVSPWQVFVSLLTFSLFTAIFAAQALAFGQVKAGPWSIILLGLGLACLVLQAVLTRKIHKRKKDILADEYTTGLLHKAAYQTLMLVSCLVSLLFVSLSVLLTLRRGAAGSLSDILDLRLVLGLLAFIQLFSLTSFLLFYFFLAKKES